MKLTIFFDGKCPLCVHEIHWLQRQDKRGVLNLIDIHSEDLSIAYPHIDPVAADRLLHGQLDDGHMLYGLEVTCLAWRLVGKGHWVAFLQWPLIKPVAKIFYKLFARHRHRLGSWFGAIKPCEACRKA